MKLVFSYLKPYRIVVVIALVLMLLELAVELTAPLILAKIIDDGVVAGDINVVLFWGAILMASSFLAFFAGIINSFYAAHAGQSTGLDLRGAMFRRIQLSSFAKLERFTTSSLIMRLTNDVTQIQNTVFMGLRIMMRAPLLILGGVVLSFFVNERLALVFLIVIPLLVITITILMKKGALFFGWVQRKLDQVNHVTRENLMALKLIKAFVRRTHEVKRFVANNEQLKDNTMKALRLMEVTQPVLLFLMNGSIIAVLWFGSFQLNTGGAQVGEIVAIVNYASRITGALTVLSMIIMVLSRAKASAGRIEEVLTHCDADEETINQQSNQQLSGLIEFDQVSFSYPESKQEILSDVSFTVPAYKTIAVLGATGSGKSSLFQMIPRLYEPTSGAIRIDGVNIDDLDLGELRESIGYVSQQTMLFSGSIRENISWGKPEADMDEVINAAQAAQIHQTIMTLPDGYDTRIGQRGVNLSGGQKQRIAIARALIRKPQILLLDDSTSALDNRTEAAFFTSLRHYPCTTIIITQKLSTAISADSILLFEHGELLAEGQHDTLLNHSAFYQELYASQY
ncbi:ABC transporter ATP-binding protein [Alkalicoccobacillus murimartini]|uniref:ATP-binding cassette subfamily B protein n=1 Tax=Alkalicoccobacillus murimartini TaxID=171685 RepID=A0ABT9YKU3_9BACI|nr:ABC transporter ATP-binding protein [Alkalicoccobacillus murimartini]MDQ0208361.1 ATP-binding cassette subfamily B protein [Alkalicoccobacillus murimartini]